MLEGHEGDSLLVMFFTASYIQFVHQVFLVSQGKEDGNIVPKWFKNAGYFSVMKLDWDIHMQREGR